MTDVEFPRLLSDLAETAKTLNKESDSINDLITSLEQSLIRINLGIEVWLESDPLASKPWRDENEAGYVTEGSRDVQLGFAKDDLGWGLLVREVNYVKDEDGDWSLRETIDTDRLTDRTRNARIKALKLFPKLAQGMRSAGQTALDAIEDAKKYVK